MRRINVMLLTFLLLVLASGCQKETRTEIYFVQSQERTDPESQSASYTGTDCTGETTEDILQVKSKFLDAYLYGVEVSKTTGLVSSDLSPENRVGFAKGCLSVEQKGFFEKRLFTVTAGKATLRATFGLYRGEDPDLEFQIDGVVSIKSILTPLGLSSLQVLASNDVNILEDPSINLLGGLATANSSTSLVGLVAGSFWTYRLIFEKDEGS